MTTNKLGDDLGGLSDTVTVYLLAGLPAYDQILSLNLDHTHGDMTLRSFYSILQTLGLYSHTVPPVQDYVFVPFATNVYTVFYPYYVDFGIVYLLISQFFSA